MIQTGALLTILGLALALLALLARHHSQRQRELLGLPEGRVISADTGSWRACERPLYSARHRLAGKPDYLVQARGTLLPVEVKPGRRAARPYPSDVLQLGAYLLLIEEETGRRPPYGLLCYASDKFEIPYTPGLRQNVIDTLEEMQRLRRARHVAPQHREPQRCRHCGHREHCRDALAWQQYLSD